MNESVTRQSPRDTRDSQARRAERGIVAGYIHELRQRHDNNTERPAPVLTSKAR